MRRRRRRSRRSPSATRRRVHTFSADVGEESDVEKLLERIRGELPPLAGVAHLAGVLDDALLTQQDLDRFRTTLAPKAFGAFYLDRLTRDDKLDFFIVSSSVSSLLGPPGQANYSTANALLDGLIADRKAHGLPATGINFGPWGGAAWPPRRPPAPTSVRRVCFRSMPRARWVPSPRWSPTAPGRRPCSRPTGRGRRKSWAARGHRSWIWCCRARWPRWSTASCSSNCRSSRCRSAPRSSPSSCSAKCRASCGSRNRRPRPAGSWTWAPTR